MEYIAQKLFYGEYYTGVYFMEYIVQKLFYGVHYTGVYLRSTLYRSLVYEVVKRSLDYGVHYIIAQIIKYIILQLRLWITVNRSLDY